MIKEFELYHGAALSKLVHETIVPVSIEPFETKNKASYVINGDIGIYIKYSSKRMTPWRFSFLKGHQDEILDMSIKLANVYVLLICSTDGIVCLNFEELKSVLDATHEDAEWVSATRRRNEKYLIKGSDGKLHLKIGRSDFPAKLFGK